MLSAFYNVFFRAEAPLRNGWPGLSVGFFSCLILAFNAAGQLQVGWLGLMGLTLLFLVLGAVGCYWYMASIHLLTQWIRMTPLRGFQNPSVPVAQPWLATLQGLWPIIFLGPAVSVQRWWPSVGGLMTLIILLSTGFTLMVSIRHAYGIHWFYAALCLGITFIVGGLALMGLLGWPLMLFLGAKNFSTAILT